VRANGNRRRARWIVIALAVVAAVVLVIAFVVPNALLKSDFIPRRMNKDPDHGWLEYASASSPWPGTLRVKGFRYRDRDPKAEWGMELDNATLDYSLADLLRRRFHATRLSGSGFIFHVRSRLTRAEATKARLARLPPIAGFPDPPLLDGAKPKAPPTGKEWSIQIDGIAIDGVREVWIEEYRCTGDARLTGAFFLRPKHRAEIFGARLAIRNGDIHYGRDVIAADVRATFDARFAPWDPIQFPGSKVLRFVSGEAEATARLDDAEVINHLLGEPAGTRIERGRGRLDARASVEKGVARGTIDDGSRDASVRALEVAMRGRFDGRVELSGIQMETWGGGRLNGGHVRLTDATFTDSDGRRYPWWGRVEFAPGLFRPRTAALFTTDATLTARDSRPLLEIVRVDLPEWTKKLLRLEESVAARVQIRVGKALVELHRLSARTGKLRIDGEYEAHGRGKSGTFLIDTGPLSVGVGISGGERNLRIFGPRKWFRERTGWEP
jgi:hypothetical protein